MVIRTDADIKNIDENKTAIFKIHGDFLVPDKLIITRDDYAKWLGEFPKTPLYNLVVSRLITKSVIFLGYSIEDINALTLINTINSQLGRKPSAMVLCFSGHSGYKSKRTAIEEHYSHTRSRRTVYRKSYIRFK